MKTLTCSEPGQFVYGEKKKPAFSKGKAILRIKRIGICGTDLHAFQGNQPFFTYPRILGHELAGELEEGNDIAGLKAGEAVTFIPYFHCGSCVACRMGKPNCCVNLQVCGVHADGGMAEYLSVPSAHLIAGNGLSFDELALVEPFAIGAHAIGTADVKPGEFVLVTGAGPIGLATMEFAQVAGGRVIALDINVNRLNFCKKILKVEYTLNGLSKNVKEQLQDITAGDMPTLIIDATGNLPAINHAFEFMAHGGRYVLIGLQPGNVSFSHPEFHKRESKLMSSRNATHEDFQNVIQAIRSGKVDPTAYVTHRVHFDHVKDEFEKWLDPNAGVIKAMVEVY